MSKDRMMAKKFEKVINREWYRRMYTPAATDMLKLSGE